MLAEGADGTSLRKVADYDLTGVLNPDERVTSALPDFRGPHLVRLQAARQGRRSWTRARGRIRVKRLGEEIENSFAVDRDGVYIVSDRRMYRFSAGRRGRPRIDWRSRYRNSGIVKPGQVDAGSGTTPTIMARRLRRDHRQRRPDERRRLPDRAAACAAGTQRIVCAGPGLRHSGASATENSLLTAGRSLVVENNYGYQDPFGPMSGALTEPGFARVDVRRGGRGCRKVWETFTERAPDRRAEALDRDRPGLHLHARRRPERQQPWFWTAISLRTGKTAFKRYAGSGLSFNNNYAGIAHRPATAPPTSASSAGWSACGTAEAGGALGWRRGR